MTLLDIVIPVELTNGNDGRGSKWFSSAKVRKKMEAKFRHLGMTRTPFQNPVRVTVIRILGRGQRKWDSSSVGRGNYKEIEDALTAIGWWHDDSPKWIENTEFQQDDSRRNEGPALRLIVAPAITDAETSESPAA